MAGDDQGDWVRDALAHHEGALLRYAASMVGPEQARDVVQDTFMRLCLQSRAEVEPKLRPWLFTVCRNRALELRRKVRPLLPVVEQAAEGVGADAALESKQRRQALRSAVAALPDRPREVLTLRIDAELSYQEIADVTGLTVSHVGFVLHDAMKRVRATVQADSGLAPLRRVP